MGSDSKVTRMTKPNLSIAIETWVAAHGDWDAVMGGAYQELQGYTVEACFTVCPSDPQAAAEAYPALLEALLSARDDLTRLTIPTKAPQYPSSDVIMEIEAALAKVGR